MRTVTINYKELTESLAKLERDYPSRMHGHIDLLRANIKYNLTQFLAGDMLTVELDDGIRMAYINGKPIAGDVYAIYDTSKNPTSAEKIYEQILEAMKSAKLLGFNEIVFHVREIENSEDGSIVVNEEDDLWNRCHTKEDYQCYLKSYPFGKFSHEARRIIKLFEVKANRRKGIFL